MTEKTLLEIAKSLEFTVLLNSENFWQVLPKSPKQTWMLTQTESRWILSVKNVSQLKLNEQEAIAFLNERSHTS
ncbi:MAG: hypothetical protein AAFO95_17980 [Cyanobacteria bacterium J06600_6]